MPKKSNTAGTADSQKSVVYLILIVAAVMLVEIFAIVMLFKAPVSGLDAEDIAQMERDAIPETEPPTEPTTEPPTEPPVIYPEAAEDMVVLDEELNCENGFLMDCDNHTVLAVKGDAEARIYPASMTKVMTLIVAVEHIDDLEETFTITEECWEPYWADGASMAGFSIGEEVSMKDLLYGVVLPSGADATVALAIYTAGSEEAFVGLMNEKCDELGLKNTHFVNTSGLFDEDHYTTMTDIALIMEYALQDELCKKVLSTYTYTTASTEQHPDGIALSSTMFNKMYGTEVKGITIMGGKTGYIDEAGQCLVSYAETPNGERYIAVSSLGAGKYSTIYDSFTLYGIVTGTYPAEN